MRFDEAYIISGVLCQYLLEYLYSLVFIMQIDKTKLAYFVYYVLWRLFIHAQS
jgi:hypothetical protein